MPKTQANEQRVSPQRETEKPVIGIVGGMGTYATIDFFKRIADAFPVEKEWDRPRILIDNRCTMPSRVRAILYGERRDELARNLAESTKNLIDAGATAVFYACNTSHVFLDEVYTLYPAARGRVIHMIDLLARDMSAQGVRRAFLLATEGTIQTGIYQNRFEGTRIDIASPDDAQQATIREFIEIVKQNKIDKRNTERFISYLSALGEENIILGCTELPVLYGARNLSTLSLPNPVSVYDPMQSAIDAIVEMHRQYENSTR